MAKGDEIMEGSVSSLIIESLESNQHGDVLSPEDLAWVDSCLIKDADKTDEGTEIVMHNPGEEAETAHLEENNDDAIRINVESETNDDSYPINKKTSFSLSKLFEADDTVETFVRYPFLPSYKAGKSVSEAIDLVLDLDPPAVEVGPLSEDAFKVWDLSFSSEEDELVTQLNKVLAESSSTINDSGTRKDLKHKSVDTLIAAESSSTIDDLLTWKDLKDESLDNLISGIANLSLDPPSS